MAKQPRVKNKCYICGREAPGHWTRNADTRGKTLWRCMRCLRALTGSRPWEQDDAVRLEPLYGRVSRNRGAR